MRIGERPAQIGNPVVQLQHLLHLLRDVVELPDDGLVCFIINRSHLLTQSKGKHGEHGYLTGERFGGSHTDLGSYVDIRSCMGGAGNAGADGVTDSIDERAVLLGQLNGSQGIGSLTTLGDGNHHITAAHHRIPVTELRSILHLNGDATEVLDDLLTDETSVPGCTASHDDDAFGIQQLFLMVDDSTECYVGSFHIDSSTHTVGETLRLFEDLLEHEMRIAALLDLTQVDINGLDLRGKLGVVDIDHLELLTALDHGDVPVLEIYHTVGVFDNRTGV